MPVTPSHAERRTDAHSLEHLPLLSLSDWPAVSQVLVGQSRVGAVSCGRAFCRLIGSRRSCCEGGLRRTAVGWQPDRNRCGFRWFCAADRRPPEPKDHSHEDADNADDRSRRGRAGAHRLRRSGRASQRDAPRSCGGVFTATRSGGGVTVGRQRPRPDEA